MINEELLVEILNDYTYPDTVDGDVFYYTMYADYRDEVGDNLLSKISISDNPRECFEESLMDAYVDAEGYDFNRLCDTIKEHYPDYNADMEDEIRDWLTDHTCSTIDWEHFEGQSVHAVVALDVGDCNYDFTGNNMLNYYSSWYGSEMPNYSPIRWLAKQQGHLGDLKKALKGGETDNKFVASVIQELENLPSHMSMLIFLVNMTLGEFIQLREKMLKDKKANDSYEYEERKGTEKFSISKHCMCGLYDVWNGGGSVLEIELEKDVKLTTKELFDVWIDCRGCKANGRGYDVDDVYGLCGSAWVEGIELG